MNKRNRPIIIASIIFVALAILFLLIGFMVADGPEAVAAWFSSKWAMIIYIVLGSYLAILVFWFLFDKVKRL